MNSLKYIMKEINKSKNSIISQKYFNMNDAIKAPIKSNKIFIISNERIKKNGEIGRYFTVFPNFEIFLKNRKKYKNCHEILIDHINNIPDPMGRLVFDFDIKYHNDTENETLYIPKNFNDQVENIIIEVIERYFNNVDINSFQFIWSTSENPAKFSKHLTVKNLYFDDWIKMSKIFYKLFCIIWDDTYDWIRSDKLIDFQIVKNRASLRMVGSKKINGHFLNFDNKNHKLTDSLIRIYLSTEKNNEKIITYTNINKNVFKNILLDEDDTFNLSVKYHINIFNNKNKIENMVYEKNIYDKSYEVFNNISPNVFKMGKINGKILLLMRIKAGKCLMSGKIHHSENAYLIINKKDDFYSIRLGCFRNCYSKKTIYLGSITGKNLIVIYNPLYKPKKINKDIL